MRRRVYLSPPSKPAAQRPGLAHLRAAVLAAGLVASGASPLSAQVAESGRRACGFDALSYGVIVSTPRRDGRYTVSSHTQCAHLSRERPSAHGRIGAGITGVVVEFGTTQPPREFPPAPPTRPLRPRG